MKKITVIITMLVLSAIMLTSALTVSAETTTAPETTTIAETTTTGENTTIEKKTTERETTPAEDTETEAKTTETPSTKREKIYVSIKDKGVAPAYASPIYIYTGKPIKPVVTVTKGDGTAVDKADYTLEYTGDCTNPGNHGVKVVYKKNGYAVEALYQIIPGTTNKINVKVKNGQVTVSWNPVPGANVYRVYKYNEETERYSEMWWSDGQIASAKTSRTFTSKELKPGEKYKMAIMALPAINWMPRSDGGGIWSFPITAGCRTFPSVSVHVQVFESFSPLINPLSSDKNLQGVQLDGLETVRKTEPEYSASQDMMHESLQLQALHDASLQTVPAHDALLFLPEQLFPAI